MTSVELRTVRAYVTQSVRANAMKMPRMPLPTAKTNVMIEHVVREGHHDVDDAAEHRVGPAR